MLLGIDRIPDMFRTVVNVTGDMVACLVTRRALPPFSDGGQGGNGSRDGGA
jgi:Na+/H+-dicarboxylate symporter